MITGPLRDWQGLEPFCTLSRKLFFYKQVYFSLVAFTWLMQKLQSFSVFWKVTFRERKLLSDSLFFGSKHVINDTSSVIWHDKLQRRIEVLVSSGQINISQVLGVNCILARVTNTLWPNMSLLKFQYIKPAQKIQWDEQL